MSQPTRMEELLQWHHRNQRLPKFKASPQLFSVVKHSLSPKESLNISSLSIMAVLLKRLYVSALRKAVI